MEQENARAGSAAETAQEGNTSPAVGTILTQILSLNQKDRAALRRALAAIEGDSVTPVAVSATAGAEEKPFTPDDLKAWLRTLDELDARSRIEALEQAVEEASEPWEKETLAARLAREKKDNMPAVVQIRVVRYAMDNPLLTLVGLFGLGAGIFYFGRGVWRLIF